MLNPFRRPLPAPIEAPKSPAAQVDLEAEVRTRVFDHLDAETAAVAHMSLDELRDFVARRYFPTAEQIMALAQAMDAPVSGLAVIREAMERLTRGKFPSWGAAGNRRRRLDTLGEEDALSHQHHAAVQAFISGDKGALTLDEINEFIRHWHNGADDAYYDPATDTLRKRDTATPMTTSPPPAVGTPFEPRTQPFADGKGYPPLLYPRDPSLPAPTPARLKPLPGWA